MADSGSRTFKLIGVFDDQISAKLKKIEGNLAKFARKSSRELGRITAQMNDFSAATNRAAAATANLNRATRGSQRVKYGSPTAAAITRTERYARQVANLRQQMQLLNLQTSKMKAPVLQMQTRRAGGGGGNRPGGNGFGADGFRGYRSGGLAGGVLAGIVGSQATLLVYEIMNALRGAFTGAFAFVQGRVQDALIDNINDIQFAAKTVGRLKLEGLLKGDGPNGDLTRQQYDQGTKFARDIQRQISKQLSSSAVDTDMVLKLVQQLGDNFIPAILSDTKFRASVADEADLGGAVGQQLAKVFEKIALATPPNYDIGFVSRGITKLIEGGKITGEIKRIDFFENNPTILAELEKVEKEFEAMSIPERINKFMETLNNILPDAAIEDLQNSMMAAGRSIRNNLIGIDIGLLSFGSDLNAAAFGAKEGQGLAANMLKLVNGQLKPVEVAIRTPFELIATKLAPAMLAFGRALRAITDKFGPITQHLATAFNRVIGPLLENLTKDIDSFGRNLGTKSIGEALGTLVGKLSKFLFDSLNAVTSTEFGFVEEFKKGFATAMSPATFKQLVDKLVEMLADGLTWAVGKAVPLMFKMLKELMISLVTKGGAAGILTAGFIASVIFNPLLKGIEFIGDHVVKATQLATKAVRPLVKNLDDVEMLRAIRQNPKSFVKGQVLPKPSAVKSLVSFQQALIKSSNPMHNFASGLVSASKYLKVMGKSTAIFSGVFAGIAAGLEGKGLAEILASALGGGAGAAIGGAIGFAIAGPIGAAIGTYLGAEVGTSDVVVKPAAEGIDQIWGTIRSAMSSLGEAVMSLLGIVGSIVRTIPFLDSGMSDMSAAITGMKVVLTPLVAGFQLIEQVVRLTAVGLQGLNVAVLHARRFLSSLNPMADPKKQQALDKEIAAETLKLDKMTAGFGTAFNRHMQWFGVEAKERERSTGVIKSQATAISSQTFALNNLTSTMNNASNKMAGLFNNITIPNITTIPGNPSSIFRYPNLQTPGPRANPLITPVNYTPATTTLVSNPQSPGNTNATYNVGDVIVNANGISDPKTVADMVGKEILAALTQAEQSTIA